MMLEISTTLISIIKYKMQQKNRLKETVKFIFKHTLKTEQRLEIGNEKY